MTLQRGLTSTGLLVGILALTTQFGLTISANVNNGMSLPAALVLFFSFFTILTNITITLIYLSALTGWRALGWFRRPVTRAMMVSVMLLVMLFYHVLLRPIWHPEGLALVCDYALHYVAPLLYTLWWTATQPHGALTMRQIPLMLAPPLIYLVYIMVRGAITTVYPYPTFNAFELGYGQVALHILAVAAGLCALFALVIAIDRALGRRSTIS